MGLTTHFRQILQCRVQEAINQMASLESQRIALITNKSHVTLNFFTTVII